MTEHANPRPAPNYPTRPAATAHQTAPTTADRGPGMLQVAILAVIGGLFLLIGIVMALSANGLQINLVIFGSALVTAGTVAITGALAVQALRR